MTPPGASGTPPPYNNPQGFSLPQTSAAAWGQAALHPTLPHSVGRAFARNSFTPPRRGRACPARSLAITTPFILCIVGRGLDPSGGVGDAAPYILGRELSANRRGGLPPSLAPLVRNPFTAVRRGRACPARSLAVVSPLPVCIVGRGLDPSAGRRGRRPLQRSARLLLIANGHGGLWAGRPTYGP